MLLDINMPIMNGWEFLDAFDNIGDNIKSGFKIYMFSSSIEIKDIERSKTRSIVSGYLMKPLLKEKIEEIINHL